MFDLDHIGASVDQHLKAIVSAPVVAVLNVKHTPSLQVSACNMAIKCQLYMPSNAVVD